MILEPYIELELPTNGSVDLYVDDDSATQIIITGTPTLVGNVTIVSTNPDINTKNLRYNILWLAEPVLGAFNISILGVTLSADEATKRGTFVTYNNGASNIVEYTPDFTQDQIISGSKIQPATITSTNMAADSVLSASIPDGEIPPEKLSAATQLESLLIPVSFETGEIGAYPYLFAYRCQIVSYVATITLETGAADNASITLSTSTGNTTGGAVEFTPAAPFGTQQSVNVDGNTNSIVASGTAAIFTTAKSTPGGKANIVFTVRRISTS